MNHSVRDSTVQYSTVQYRRSGRRPAEVTLDDQRTPTSLPAHTAAFFAARANFESLPPSQPSSSFLPLPALLLSTMSLRNPTSVSEQYPDLQKWQQATVLASPSSSELMTGSKFIGRECADVNTEFLKCKMVKGEHPGLCVKEGDLVRLCTKNV
jgi:hypothetical protein